MFSKVLISGPQKLALYGKELKAVADNKVKGDSNIVGTGGNAGNQHFHLFPQCFQKSSLQVLKSWHCMVKS